MILSADLIVVAWRGAADAPVSASTAVANKQPRQRLSGALAGTTVPQRSQVRVMFMGLLVLAPILTVTPGKDDQKGQGESPKPEVRAPKSRIRPRQWPDDKAARRCRSSSSIWSGVATV